MRELTVHAKPTNNKAKKLYFLLLGIAALDVITYILLRNLGIPKSGLVGVLAVVLITAAVFIYTKYVGPRYYYEITADSYGTPVFVVRQENGKRATTLVRISLSDIARLDRESAAGRKAHTTPYGVRKYFYIPTLYPSVTYRMTVSSRYEKAEVIIEITDELADFLRREISEAKALALASSEEEDC